MQNDLADHRANVHSQAGEDGVITEILSRLGVLDAAHPRWCVEFGAWDGVHLSNTCNLIRNHGFRAVLIEGSKRRYRQLCRNFPGDTVAKLCGFVGFEASDNLDAHLSRTDIPRDFDFLSIDVDGCDYHVWESLTAYRPKVVCIEFNPTIPLDVEFVQPRDFSVKWGSSLKAFDTLARRLGYTPVAVTDANLVSVRDDLVTKVVGDDLRSVEELTSGAARRLVFIGFDGTVLTNFDRLPMPWHAIEGRPEDIQVLPRFLRRYSGDYNPSQRMVWAVLTALKK
ncbi:class I SAM-dependent methyltransferase [Roseovarius salinarum]|uniref:hypothetical protein n=1 Tax=Roseovarius salinarum TaxID=1981892 RepID=UPI000C31D5AD|nr:hypothetical protein [Roseovarius salinarum]